MSSTSAHHMNCCVWDQYKYAMYTRFREPKMYQYAARGDWDLIPNRCVSHPKEASFVHKYAPMDTALHRLLRTKSCVKCDDDIQADIYQMRKQAVAALLDVYPTAASTKDTFQRTPLHWACMDVASNCLPLNHDGSTSQDSILLMLIERSSQAVSMTDMERRTPLHYLVSRNDGIPMEVLAKLVAICPKALTMKDEVGETPLDIIQSRKDELHNVSEIVRTLSKLQSLLSPSAQELLPTEEDQPMEEELQEVPTEEDQPMEEELQEQA
jgi:hypothetical protein